MTGEEIFNLLSKMAVKGESPRKREKKLRKLAEKLELSSDALRAKARRYARKAGIEYPLMRKRAVRNREREREDLRTVRRSWRDERLAEGEAALARGAGWKEIADLFGIKTAEGAAQWWRRNKEGAAATKRKTRRKKSRRKVAAPVQAQA